MHQIHPSRWTTSMYWTVKLGAAFVIGLVFWLIYRWTPDLFPFVIAYSIVSPWTKAIREGKF